MVSMSQSEALRILEEHKELNTTEIANLADCTQSNISRALNCLAKQGYITGRDDNSRKGRLPKIWRVKRNI